ncbi:MAG: hypothetical protein EBR09_10455 [Proteobacteria bacterium]|nr:hypothetical protein [Pseudomonadota bacterium]
MNREMTISGNGLKDFFLDMRSVRFSGEIKFKFVDHKKSVFLQNGEITHCNSTLLDDRLGDVIYREGNLTLDLFVELAGKVSEKTRFGDLLIQNGIFTLVDLWDALNCQSKAILQSLIFHDLLELELVDADNLKTPDFGLRFRWDEAINEALHELRLIRRFERALRQSPSLTIDERNRSLANTDFLRDILSLIEHFYDFNVIVDEKSPLSKVYTVRALFQLFSTGVITDTWDIFSQDLEGPAEHELQGVVSSSSRVFLAIEELAQKHSLAGWDAAVKRAVKILEREFGQGVHLISGQGFSLQQIHKSIALNREFKNRVTAAQEHRWPLSVVTLIQEGLHKSILYLLFETSNNRAMEEESRKIHAELVNSRRSYFSSVAEALY